MIPLVSASGISVCFQRNFVLRDVDLEIERGEIVTIVGPNGSGKTTLLRAMIGAQKPSTGYLRHAPSLMIGYVPQMLAIDRSMPLSVSGFLGLAGKFGNAPITAALERVGALASLREQVAHLSGGQLQRVLLARAILRQPDLLVLDEPTKGLDQPGTAAFYHLLSDVRAELGCAVLMVSHDLHVVMSASDRVVCINGHICCQGTPNVVSEAPEYRQLFGSGTAGALALYQHSHDHVHSERSPDTPVQERQSV